MMGVISFGAIWILTFIKELTQFVCFVSASTFYFSSSKDKEGSAEVFTGIKLAHFKHCGSLALGGLIHTIMAILRALVEQAARSEGRGGGVAAVIACCAICLVRCMEDIIEYLNKISLAYMAISGESYCTSAWNGFLLNLKHLIKFYFAQTIAAWFVFLGFLFICGVNIGVYYLIIWKSGALHQMSSSLVPMFMILFISLYMTKVFLGLFNEAVLGTLMSLAVDLDLNGTPKHGPPDMHTRLAKIYEVEKQTGAHGYDHHPEAQQY